jgi:ATP-dependent DNA helicase DinG
MSTAPSSWRWLEAVWGALRGGHHLIAEAGTGVGKSLPTWFRRFLAVSEEYAKDDKDAVRRVVVSTHTISLQEQLLHKDLPLLNSVIPREFTSVLVKGRRNYISLRRLETALARAGTMFASDEDLQQLREIRTWAKQTTDGSLSDLSFQPVNQVWDEVASDSGNCMGRNCPKYKECFYFLARRRVYNAQILIVNHALFFSDLALRRAGGQLVAQIRCGHLGRSAYGRIGGRRSSGDQRQFGPGPVGAEQAVQRPHEQGLAGLSQLAERGAGDRALSGPGGRFLPRLHHWLAEQKETNGRVRQPGIIDNRLSPALENLAVMIRQRAERLDNETQRQDFYSAYERLLTLAGNIEAWRTQEIPEAVYWLEGGFRGATGCSSICPRLRSTSAHVAQGVVQRDAQRDPDQRDALGGPPGIVRLLPVPDRADAERVRCAWTARSITGVRSG